jgi:opacity protein-like surface antigen
MHRSIADCAMHEVTASQRRVLIAIVAIVTGLSHTAQAQWRVDLEGGASIPASGVDLTASGSQFDTAVSVGGSYAVGGGYAFLDWLEATAQFQQSFMGLFTVLGTSLDLYSFTAGGRVYLLPPGRFRPWLVSQIGWYRTNATASFFGGDVTRTDDSFGLNAGAGFDITVTDRVSLGLDVRYHNAFQALDGFQAVTTMFNVGLHFGK